jgi:hypothetical protein
VAQVREQTIPDLELELKTMRARLAASERQLDASRRRLNQFGTLYQTTVGERFEILRKLQVALGMVSEQTGQDADPVKAPLTDAPRASRAEGHTEFERLYRDFARRVHPDLARDPAELELRTRFMAELNNARETLDFERVRRLGDAWKFQSEDFAPEAFGAPHERLSMAIERVQARLTAVAADITRLRTSNLYVLMEIVDAQQRAGTDMLAETAADLDLQIAEARARMAVATRRPPDLTPKPERPLAVFQEPLAFAAKTGTPMFLVAAIAAGCIALVAALAAMALQTSPLVITPAAANARPASLAPRDATPPPASYRVAAREVSPSGRSTAIVRIVVDGAPTNAEKISTLAQAARAEIGAQQAVTILAYRTAAEVGGPFTVGRAYLSVDARGWSGDGKTEDGLDTGGVTGAIVVGLSTLETRTFAVER